MDNVIQYGALGLLALVLGAFGIFFAKKIWPWMTRRIEASEQHLKEQATNCENRLEEMSKAFADTVDRQARATEKLVEGIEKMLQRNRR